MIRRTTPLNLGRRLTLIRADFFIFICENPRGSASHSHVGLRRGSARCLPLTILLLGLIVLTACRPVAYVPVRPTPTVYHAPPTPAIYKPVTPLPKPHPEVGPTSVLLLGTDRRGPEVGTDNTDTLMLLSLDPAARRMAILSIPRDLYVSRSRAGTHQYRLRLGRAGRDGRPGPGPPDRLCHSWHPGPTRRLF